MSDARDRSAQKLRLKLIEPASSLRSDGSRNFVHPADVQGRFERARKLSFTLLIGLLVALPWIPIGGRPALFLDFEHRSFYLFGATFNAQDFWLVFFLVSALGFALIVAAALFGRVWCGYACPHTVFLEGVFRPVERWLEGPRNERLRRNQAPWSFDKLWRKALKHALYLVFAFAIAHIIVSYFVSLPRLYAMVSARPSAHPEAFVWASALTGVLYFNFSWFREQLCLVVCPYGRLQSVLADDDTLVIGYDTQRGEPRGKRGTQGAGDCVDCGRCVVVCPTGIDIRNGLQIDCIGCARCIDACDDVMDKLGRAPGLVRYDSQNALTKRVTRFLRPRVYMYGALGVVGCIALSFALARSAPLEANLLRLRDPFVVEGTRVRNAFEIHLVNKRGNTTSFQLRGHPEAGQRYTIAMPELQLAPLGDARVPVFVEFDAKSHSAASTARIDVLSGGHVLKSLQAPLLAPR